MNWQFGPAAQEAGWRDTSFNAFKNAPRKNLVREIIQNSLDNPHRDIGDQPVIVEFEEYHVPPMTLPGMDNYKLELEKCLKEEKNVDDKKRIKDAIDRLEQNKIYMLRITDRNTTGILNTGQKNAQDNPWYRYTRTTGVSFGADRAGSFGHGKFAPFSCSTLRMMYLMTKYNDGGQKKEFFQGLCFIRTRQNEFSKREVERHFDAFGYYGDDNLEPCSEIPGELSDLCGDEQGTTLLLPGWSRVDNWEKSIISYVISNYFAAVYNGRLEVLVKGKSINEIIDKGTLSRFLNGNLFDVLKEHLSAMEDKKHEAMLDRSKYYLECFQHEDVEENNLPTNSTFKNVKLRFLKREGAPKSLAIVRRDMLITDADTSFFPSRVKEDFAALVTFTSEGENALRKFEDASHTVLSHSELPESERINGKRDLDNLKKILKDKLKELVQQGVEEIPKEITILRQFFPNMNDVLNNELGEFDEPHPDGDFIVGGEERKRASVIPLFNPEEGNVSEVNTPRYLPHTDVKRKKQKKKRYKKPGPGPHDVPGSISRLAKMKTATVLKLKVTHARNSKVKLAVSVSETGTYRIAIEELGASDKEKIFGRDYELTGGEIHNIDIDLPTIILGGIRPFIAQK